MHRLGEQKAGILGTASRSEGWLNLSGEGVWREQGGEPKRAWLFSSTCLPRGSKHDKIIISPTTHPWRRLGRAPRLSSGAGGSGHLEPGRREGTSRRQRTGCRDKGPGLQTSALQRGWPVGVTQCGPTEPVSAITGQDHLPSGHAAGPCVLAPLHLAGPPPRVLAKEREGSWAVCDLWAQRCQSEPSSSSLSSWPASCSRAREKSGHRGDRVNRWQEPRPWRAPERPAPSGP